MQLKYKSDFYSSPFFQIIKKSESVRVESNEEPKTLVSLSVMSVCVAMYLKLNYVNSHIVFVSVKKEANFSCIQFCTCNLTS